MMRVAAITGANKGIGYHVALQLAQSGLFTNVILACRDTTRGLEAKNKIQSQLEQGSSNNGNNGVQVSYEQLEIGNDASHEQFCNVMTEKYGGKVDVLVNNAAMAFKGSDPTPFKEQCKATLDINFRGTVDFTEKMIPLLRKGNDARIVNVASMAGRIKQIKSTELRNQFLDSSLSKEQLMALVDQFERDVLEGVHTEKGWGNSNYGMSKLALVAMTKVWAREEASNGIKVNCCCPGYCDTDMTSHKGPRPPSEGARNAVIPATMETSECPTGEFFENNAIGKW
jgi:carbonyl reductase 1